MTHRFFDSHAHLDGKQFKSDLDNVLARAEEAGLTDIICIGASHGLASNEGALALAEQHAHIHATVGLHPHEATLVDDDSLQKIREWAKHPKVVAIGETGLDYHYDFSPRDVQQAAFRTFLAMAQELDLPCIIHTREAEDDTIQILREAGAQHMTGVFHCFTGTRKLADAAEELGFYLSFSGVLTFKNAEELQDIARNAPRDRVLVETDCPYLAPIPHRGKRNEPSYVVHTATKLAELWGVSEEEVRRVTGANAAQFFGL